MLVQALRVFHGLGRWPGKPLGRLNAAWRTGLAPRLGSDPERRTLSLTVHTVEVAKALSTCQPVPSLLRGGIASLPRGDELAK